MINDQYIGNLKGLKLELDLKADALDSDIKSLKNKPKTMGNFCSISSGQAVVGIDSLKHFQRNTFLLYQSEHLLPTALYLYSKFHLFEI